MGERRWWRREEEKNREGMNVGEENEFGKLGLIRLGTVISNRVVF
jgi:hypothetical protein